MIIIFFMNIVHKMVYCMFVRTNHSTPKILVTGATGKTGAAVTRLLLRDGFEVRAIVRKEDARSAQLRNLGAETKVVDVFDSQQWSDSLKGISRAYFVPFFDPYMIQSAAAFAAAVPGSNLESLVQLSQWIASPRHPSLHTRQLWLTEELFSGLPGIQHTILNPGYFADNFLRLMDFSSTLGIYPDLTGESRSAPISNEDIARAAVALLKNPSRFQKKSYRPTGATLVGTREITSMISEVLGRRVLRVPMPMWMMLRAARIQGVNPFELDGFRFYVEDHKQGAFSISGVNHELEELTGSPAEPLTETLRRYASRNDVQRNLGNWARVFMQFNMVPFVAGHNFTSLAKSKGFPAPTNPEMTLQSDVWRQTHLPQGLKGARS